MRLQGPTVTVTVVVAAAIGAIVVMVGQVAVPEVHPGQTAVVREPIGQAIGRVEPMHGHATDHRGPKSLSARGQVR